MVRWALPLAALALSCACLESSVGFCGAASFIGASRGGNRPWDGVTAAARKQWTRLQAASQELQQLAGSGGGSQVAEVTRLINRGPVPPGQRDFLINGWRWHSLSVIRDLGRLRAVAEQEQQQQQQQQGAGGGPSRLPQCYDFVWGFSGAALQRIEADLFYPWLRATLPPEARPVLDQLEQDRATVGRLGQDLGMACRGLQQHHPHRPGAMDRKASLGQVVALATQMEERVRELVGRQEALVVPLVAAYVRAAEQKKFNNKVIARLGLLDSRIHLVCMAEALRGNAREQDKFRAQIPSVAQLMLPRWREKLYLPRAQCLEEGSSSRASSSSRR